MSNIVRTHSIIRPSISINRKTSYVVKKQAVKDAMKALNKGLYHQTVSQLNEEDDSMG